jgi:hypothetical protein
VYYSVLLLNTQRRPPVIHQIGDCELRACLEVMVKEMFPTLEGIQLLSQLCFLASCSRNDMFEDGEFEIVHTQVQLVH